MDDEPLDNKEMLESTDNFEAAYESHSKAIYKFLFWRTKDVQLSEDLTSSTFEKAWASRESFRGSSEKAWLYLIARNVLIDHWRKKKELFVEDTDVLHEDVRPSAGELLDKELAIQDLRKALSKLPEDMHSVVTLRFIEGQSCKQVAASLNLSESNVRVIQYRALKKLKEQLQ
ncbi:MAG TPA: RNA polymerase sigma factor [Candidatus Saccharimonadales bacterium]|jgi:RNA polymerase sigma-70 factor (ECF subfamily)|nr:RNA polymerase sigma factor [Candidatus Saccharimonadales bacterium]